MKKKRLFDSGIIALPLFVLISCDGGNRSELPGSPPASDTRLRSLLEVSTLGGRYETPPGAKSAGLIVRFFENGEQVGRGPLLSIPIGNGILDCEFLVHEKTGRIFTPNVGITDTDGFYEKVGKSWTNTGSGKFSDLPLYGDVRVLGFLTSGLDRDGSELAGTPDFKYHIENASHIVALFAVASEKDWEEERNLRNDLESTVFGLAMSRQQAEAEKHGTDQPVNAPDSEVE